MKHFIHTLLIIIVATITCTAQEVDLFEAPNNILGGLNDEAEGVVGAIGGTVDVSALGGATYTIPIQVPEGIHGIQPNLSIVYNSQSGNGLLGWGWNLGGLSAITRTGSTIYHDGRMSGVNFSTHDRFALDGQRLMVLDGAIYGSNEAEYRTEIDGMSKIVSYSGSGIVHGPKHFKVWTSDGLILEYGNSTESRFAFITSGGNEVGMWMLNKVSDRDGNYMTYEYDKDEESIRLSKILYTNRENLPGCFSVVFNYESRNDIELSFIGDHAVKQKALLKSIQLKQADEELYRYDFTYDEEAGMYNSFLYYNRLTQVLYTSGEYHYNPTIIHWGEIGAIQNNLYPDCKDFYITELDRVGFSPASIIDKVKFAGDFNGDGLSDYIVATKFVDFGKNGILDTLDRNDNNNIWQLDFYLNKGYTMDDANNRSLRYEHNGHIIILQGIKWCFVCDIDGDGLDDVYVQTNIPGDGLHLFTSDECIYAYRSAVGENGEWDLEEVWFEDEEGHHELNYKKQVNKSKPASFMVGDFCGRGRIEGILAPQKLYGQYPKIVYFTYEDNVIKAKEGQVAFIGTTFRTGDFDGDGITEIWYASSLEGNEKGVIRKIYQPEPGEYSCFNLKSNFLSAKHNVFTADFNGDGHTDFFYYDKKNKKWKAEICSLPSEADNPYVFDLTYVLRNYYAEADPGEYGYTLDGRILSEDNDRYYLELADINGDGKTDLVIRNNTKVVFFYGPLITPGIQSTFSNIGRPPYDADALGFAGSKSYSICSGNFFGHENYALLNDYTIHSARSISEYYNVIDITDGMGNKTEYEYDYLTNNPHERADNIYTLSRDAEDRENDILAIALPTKAVKKTISHNTVDPYDVKTINEYTYKGILFHRKGKGILGFSGCTVESYINGAPFHDYVERNFNVSMMGEYRALMLASENTFLKKVVNGHMKRITETTFTYDKHVHTKNDKVFMPLLTDQVTDFYDIYHQENGFPIFMKRDVLHNDYGFWSGKNVIDYKNYFIATTSSQNITNYQDCEFLGKWGYDIFGNDINNWLIQCPLNVGVGNGRLLYEDIYYYDSYKPHQLKSLVRYPQQHYASEYATRTDYTYDAAGNIKTETLSEENGNNLKPRKTEYFYNNYRLLKTKREWLDENQGLYYDTEYDYDPSFDLIIKETNCRGQVTQFDQDPLGIECSTISPNGIETHTQTGWLVDNSGYYQWSYTQGSSPTLTTYDLAGRVHKVETYGFNEGQLIVKNYYYNNLGQLERQEDAHCDDEYIPTTKYFYDDYGALRKTIYPNGNTTRIKHDDEDRFKILTETTTDDNEVHTTAKKTNAIGQVVTSWDEANNAVSYTYTLDGLLETATVNNDPSTTIKIEYDEARNRIRLHDPDYCGNGNDLISTYDAFGQLKTTTTPKGDITSYDYDAFGRTITRTEGNDITQWFFYDSEPQFKGLLKTVSLNEGQEKTTYEYDPATRRLVSTLETINGITYNPTKYSYNDWGKTETIQYPSGIKIGKNYTSTGHLVQITDNEGKNLWTTEEKNGMGQVTLFSTGENTSALHGDYKYYKKTHLLENQLVKDKKGNTIHHFWYKYDNFSNLERRTTDIYWISESFPKYDELNRLKHSVVKYRENEYISDIEYDDNNFGCIKSKTAAYDGAPSIVSAEYGIEGRPHAIRTANMDIEAFPTAKLETQYTSFDKLSSIIQYDDNGEIDRSLSYQYGYDHQRIYMVESDGQDVIRTKTYIGNCEYISENGGNKVYTYLTGPLGLFAVYEQDENQGQVTNEKLHYIFTDHLGSITTIADNRGNVEQRLSYDAWGNLRNAKTWCSAFVGTPMLDRGFTGHEHLYNFGLINMNGRMYDPVMSCFLSPDNYIQSPENSQSFNRYAYCMNNPLKYTDPDGEYWHLVIGALIGGTANVLANLNHIESFGQGLGYFGIGALAGGLSAGVGAGVSSLIGAGTFGAGFVGSATAGTAVSSFTSGAVIGASYGFTHDFITGTGNSWMTGHTLGKGITDGLLSGMAGMGRSALFGGVIGGINAVLDNRDFFTGDKTILCDRQSRYPTGVYQQANAKTKDCGPICGQMIGDRHGSTKLPSDYRTSYNRSGKGSKVWTTSYDGVDDVPFWENYAEIEGYSFDRINVPKYEGKNLAGEVYSKFLSGYDVPITESAVDHSVVLSQVEYKMHIKWGTAEVNITPGNCWVIDPDTGYLKRYNVHDAFNIFFLLKR